MVQTASPKPAESAVNENLHRNVARVLAAEDIDVNFAAVHTASFDTKSRQLTLPQWEVSKNVFDMLVAHEVSHALFTPVSLCTRWALKHGTHTFSVINIVEDIRIERKIQIKYPGLVRIWGLAYDEVKESNILGVMHNDIQKFTKRQDRLNVFAKFGDRFGMLQGEELEFYNRCYAAETADEVFKLAEELLELVKGDYKKPEEGEEGDGEGQPQESDESQSGGGSPSSYDGAPDKPKSESKSKEASEKKGDENGKTKSGAQSKASDKDDDSNDGSPSDDKTEGDSKSNSEKPSKGAARSGAGQMKIGEPDFGSDTQSKIDSSVEQSAKAGASQSKTFFKSSFSDVENMIIPFKKVMESRSCVKSNRFEKWYGEQRDAAKVLVAEFNRKKSADVYRRAESSRTGNVDPNRLHRFRYEDDLFKRVTRLPIGKSHGMTMIIDFSGSMSNMIKPTIERAVILAEFCRMINVPFDIFSFTSVHSNSASNITNRITYNALLMIQQLSNKMSKSVYMKALHQIHALMIDSNALSFNRSGSNYDIMGGTPLSEAIFAASWWAWKMREDNHLDRVSLIVLSDGCGSAGGPLPNNSCYGSIGSSTIGNRPHIQMPDGKYQKFTYESITSNSSKYWEAEHMKWMSKNGFDTCHIFLASLVPDYAFLGQKGVQQAKADAQAKLNRDGMVSIKNGTSGYDEYIVLSAVEKKKRRIKTAGKSVTSLTSVLESNKSAKTAVRAFSKVFIGNIA